MTFDGMMREWSLPWIRCGLRRIWFCRSRTDCGHSTPRARLTHGPRRAEILSRARHRQPQSKGSREYEHSRPVLADRRRASAVLEVTCGVGVALQPLSHSLTSKTVDISRDNSEARCRFGLLLCAPTRFSLFHPISTCSSAAL